MNNFEFHDAATQLAAGRTTYSLARELLGTKEERAVLRDTLEQMEAEEGQEILALRENLDEAQTLAMQLTAVAMNLRNRCKDLEAELPRPRHVRRIGDQSIELTFHSCRLAGEFERLITSQRGKPA